MLLPTTRFTLAAFGMSLLSVFTPGCNRFGGPPTIRGSGVAKTEVRQVGDFSGIEVGGNVELEVKVGPAASLEVTTDDNLLPHVHTKMAGDRLSIYTEGSYWTKLGVKVAVSTPTLRSLTAEGATTARVRDVSGGEFKLNVSGTSSCDLAGSADAILLDVAGASRATLTGSAERLEVDCSGSSEVEAMGMKVKIARAEATGASAVRLAATDALDLQASGASTIRYTGSAAKVEQEVSGASSIAAE